jgi:hypothetical protein
LFSLYDNSLKFLKKCINNAFYKIQNNVTQKDFIKNLKLNIVNSIGTNISTRLIHERKEKSFHLKTGSCNRCKLDSCNICNFVEETDFIKINNFLFPIQSKSTCTSKGIIYIIFCSFCNTFYIGQSECLKDRMYNHIYDIKKFKYPFSEFKSVALHFNLKYHDYKKHFSFFVLRKNIENLEERLIIESFLINFCKKLGVRLMNDHIPEIKDYYSLRNLKLKL